MPRVFSVASWNVEHFGNEAARVRRIAEFISGQHGGPARVPEIFALYEVEGKEIFQEFMTRFPDHRFHVTEGRQTQEIFIGVHRRLQSFTTQRLEFKTQREFQRPGLLLTVNVAGTNYSLLFLHVRSGSSTEDFGLRDAALNHAFSLKRALDRAVQGAANFLFLGDLNTMGIDDPVPYSRVLNLSTEDEVERLRGWALRRDMVLLNKETTEVEGLEREVSWYNGSRHYEPTNLDHVLASDQLDIRGPGVGRNVVSVLGWPRLPQNQWQDWFTQYSDHAMLLFEVWS